MDMQFLRWGIIMQGFTQQELYDMWLNFRDSPNAVVILSDFMIAKKREAKKLIEHFEIRYQSQLLNSSNRGKENRGC
ncbi:MAG: hypothetical protein ACOYEG_13205 [Petrimonas sp.]